MKQLTIRSNKMHPVWPSVVRYRLVISHSPDRMPLENAYRVELSQPFAVKRPRRRGHIPPVIINSPASGRRGIRQYGGLLLIRGINLPVFVRPRIGQNI